MINNETFKNDAIEDTIDVLLCKNAPAKVKVKAAGKVDEKGRASGGVSVGISKSGKTDGGNKYKAELNATGSVNDKGKPSGSVEAEITLDF